MSFKNVNCKILMDVTLLLEQAFKGGIPDGHLFRMPVIQFSTL